MSRILAREYLFKITFEYQFQKQKDQELLNEFLQDENLTEDDKKFIENSFDGMIENQQKIDEVIANHLKGYTIGRVYKIDLAILKVAIYEMLFSSQNTPKTVIINEAVELAKKYSTDNSYRFVNGVLATVSKEQTDKQ